VKSFCHFFWLEKNSLYEAWFHAFDILWVFSEENSSAYKFIQIFEISLKKCLY
jgi:hypothetical protein